MLTIALAIALLRLVMDGLGRGTRSEWSVEGYSEDTVRSLLNALGLPTTGLQSMPRFATENDIWLTNEVVVRMPKNAGSARAMGREPLAIEAARRAGVLVPELLQFGTTEPGAIPYTVFERARGCPLGTGSSSAGEVRALVSRLGTEMAKLHAADVPSAQRRLLKTVDLEFAPYCLELCRKKRAFSTRDTERIERWIERLQSSVNRTSTRSFVHADLHPWNVLVEPRSVALTAIIDWSSAGWGDPACDFAGFPLALTPVMLAAAQEAGDAQAQDIEGRILWQWLSLALWEMAELDLSGLDREWWRWPVGGIDEAAAILAEQSPAWRKWAL